jgi:hypothetical protein
MPTFFLRIRTLAVGASVLALLVVAAGSVLAGGNPPTLYACYDVNGNVRMSDKNMCQLSGGGRLVYWSTAGVPGPGGATGPTGPQGATGAQGAAGPSGVRVWAYIAADGTIIRSSGNLTVHHLLFAYCIHLIGIDPTTVVAFVQPKKPGLNVGNGVNIVVPDPGETGCEIGGIQVEIFDTLYGHGDQDAPFYFMVP